MTIFPVNLVSVFSEVGKKTCRCAAITEFCISLYQKTIEDTAVIALTTLFISLPSDFHMNATTWSKKSQNVRNECMFEVRKFQLAISSRLAMAHEKPEGASEAPSPPVKSGEHAYMYKLW